MFLLDNICIRFGTKLFRQMVGIPMGTNCTPLVADLSCYDMKETSWYLFLKKNNLVIEAFRSTCRYLDDLLNIDNKYFDGLQVIFYFLWDIESILVILKIEYCLNRC